MIINALWNFSNYQTGIEKQTLWAQVGKRSIAKRQIFASKGRKVKEIILPKGTNKEYFSVSELTIGIYTYKQLNHDLPTQTGKLLIK